MKIPLIIALSVSILLHLLLLNYSPSERATIHQICVDNFAKPIKHKEALQALACGARIQDPQTVLLFAKSSLLHLLIVSGSHLIFVDQVLGFLRIPFFVRFLLCLLYSFACNFEAPVVRALGANLIRGLWAYFRCHLPRDREPLFSSFWALLVKPDWALSLSFMMSWCASLSLNSPLRGALSTATASYVLMLAPILWITTSHPVGIIFNLFLAPLLSFVLFPLALSTWLLPTEDLFSFIFEKLLLALEALTQGLPPQREPPQSWSFAYLWLWVMSFHVFFYWSKNAKK